MENKYLFVMAQFDEETEKQLSKIKNSLHKAGFFGTQSPNFQNHITLGQFELTKEAELKDKIIKVSNITKKIKVSFNNIGLFGLNVLFVAPSVTHELLDLQEQFNSNYPNNLNWTPHTTMLIDEPDIIIKALPVLSENFKSFSGFIDSISLYEFSPSRFILHEKLL